MIIFIFIKSKNEVAEIRGVFKKLGGLGENGALLSYLALFQGKCGALSLRNTGSPDGTQSEIAIHFTSHLVRGRSPELGEGKKTKGT